MPDAPSNFDFQALFKPMHRSHYLIIGLILVILISPLTFLPTNQLLNDELVTINVEINTDSRAGNRQSFGLLIFISTNYDMKIGIPANESLIDIEFLSGIGDNVSRIETTYTYPDFLNYHNTFSLLKPQAAYSTTVEGSGITTRFNIVEIQVDIYFDELTRIEDPDEARETPFYKLTPQNFMMVPVLTNIFARDTGFVYISKTVYADSHWDTFAYQIPNYDIALSTALIYRNVIALVISTYLIIVFLFKRDIIKTGRNDEDDASKEDRDLYPERK